MPQAKKEAAAKLERSLFGEKENSPINNSLTKSDGEPESEKIN